jgi:hypothetical protein
MKKLLAAAAVMALLLAIAIAGLASFPWGGGGPIG